MKLNIRKHDQIEGLKTEAHSNPSYANKLIYIVLRDGITGHRRVESILERDFTKEIAHFFDTFNTAQDAFLALVKRDCMEETE